MEENQILRALFEEIGGSSDKFDKFQRDFMNSQELRNAVYDEAGIAPDKREKLYNDIVNGASPMPEPRAAALPPTLERVPVLNRPQGVLAPEGQQGSLTPSRASQITGDGRLTTEFFGLPKDGKIDLPIVEDDGSVKVRSVRDTGIFSEPKRDGDSLYAEYTIEFPDEDPFTRSLRNLPGQFPTDQPIPSKTHRVYLGPSDEFIEGYNNMDELQRQVEYERNPAFQEQVKKASLAEFNNKMGLTSDEEVDYVLSGSTSNEDVYLAQRVLRKSSNKIGQEIGLLEKSLYEKYPEEFERLAEIDDLIEDRVIKRESLISGKFDTTEVDRELKDLFEQRDMALGVEVILEDGMRVPFGELPELAMKEELGNRLNLLAEQYAETYEGSIAQDRDRIAEVRRNYVNSQVEQAYGDGIPFNYHFHHLAARLGAWANRTAGSYIALFGAETGNEEVAEYGRYLVNLGEASKGTANRGGIWRRELMLEDGNKAIVGDDGDLLGVEDEKGFDVTDDYDQYQIHQIQGYIADNEDAIEVSKFNAGRIANTILDIGLDLSSMILPGAAGTKIGERVLLTAAKRSPKIASTVLQKEVGKGILDKSAKSVLTKATKSALSRPNTALSVYTATFGRNYAAALDEGLDYDQALINARQNSAVESFLTVAIGGLESRLTGGVLNKVSPSKLRDGLSSIIAGKVTTKEAVNSIFSGFQQYVKDVALEVIEELTTEVAQAQVDYMHGIGDGTVSEGEAWDVTVGSLGLSMIIAAPGAYTRGMAYRTRRQGDLRPIVAQGMIENLETVLDQVDYVATNLKEREGINLSQLQISSIKEELREIKKRYDALPDRLSNEEKQMIVSNDLASLENEIHEQDDLIRASKRRYYQLANNLIIAKDATDQQLQEWEAELERLNEEFGYEIPEATPEEAAEEAVEEEPEVTVPQTPEEASQEVSDDISQMSFEARTEIALSPVQEKMDNNEPLNPEDKERSRNVLYDLLEEAQEDERLSDDARQSIEQSLESVIQKIESYEPTTTDTTGEVAEGEAVSDTQTTGIVESNESTNKFAVTPKRIAESGRRRVTSTYTSGSRQIRSHRDEDGNWRVTSTNRLITNPDQISELVENQQEEVDSSQNGEMITESGVVRGRFEEDGEGGIQFVDTEGNVTPIDSASLRFEDTILDENDNVTGVIVSDSPRNIGQPRNRFVINDGDIALDMYIKHREIVEDLGFDPALQEMLEEELPPEQQPEAETPRQPSGRELRRQRRREREAQRQAQRATINIGKNEATFERNEEGDWVSEKGKVVEADSPLGKRLENAQEEAVPEAEVAAEPTTPETTESVQEATTPEATVPEAAVPEETTPTTETQTEEAQPSAAEEAAPEQKETETTSEDTPQTATESVAQESTERASTKTPSTQTRQRSQRQPRETRSTSKKAKVPPPPAKTSQREPRVRRNRDVESKLEQVEAKDGSESYFIGADGKAVPVVKQNGKWYRTSQGKVVRGTGPVSETIAKELEFRTNKPKPVGVKTGDTVMVTLDSGTIRTYIWKDDRWFQHNPNTNQTNRIPEDNIELIQRANENYILSDGGQQEGTPTEKQREPDNISKALGKVADDLKGISSNPNAFGLTAKAAEYAVRGVKFAYDHGMPLFDSVRSAFNYAIQNGFQGTIGDFFTWATETIDKALVTSFPATRTPQDAISNIEQRRDLYSQELEANREQVRDIDNSLTQEERRANFQEVKEAPSREEVRGDKSKTPQVGDKVLYNGEIRPVERVSGRTLTLDGGQQINTSEGLYEGVVPKSAQVARLNLSPTEVRSAKRALSNSIMEFFSSLEGVAGNIVTDLNEMVFRLNSLGFSTIEGWYQAKRTTKASLPQEPIKTEDGYVYGFYDPETNKIYLDPRYMTPETTMEEFIHMWQKAIKVAALKGDKAAQSLLNSLESVFGAEVDKVVNGKSRSVFGIGLDSYAQREGESKQDFRDRMLEEAWAKAMTPTALSKFREQRGNKVVGLFNKVKNWALSKMGIKRSSVSENPNVTELMEQMSDSFLKGEYFKNLIDSKAVPQDTRSQLVERITDLQLRLNDMGFAISDINQAVQRVVDLDRVKVTTPVDDRKTTSKVPETAKKVQDFRAKLESAYRQTDRIKNMSERAAQREIDAAIDIYYGVAEYWASLEKGRTPEQFFSEVLEDISFESDLTDRGQARRTSPNKWAIAIGEQADGSTLMHELAHVFEQLLSPQELQSMADWLGFPTWDGTTNQREAFADGFLAYIFESDSNHPIKNIFNKFADFIATLVSGIINNQVSKGQPYLPPAVKDLYSKVTNHRLERATPANIKKKMNHRRNVTKNVEGAELKFNNKEFTSILEWVHQQKKHDHEWSGYHRTTLEEITRRAYKRGLMNIDILTQIAEDVYTLHDAGQEYGTFDNPPLGVDVQIALGYVTAALRERRARLLAKSNMTTEDHISLDEITTNLDKLSRLASLDRSVSGLKLGLGSKEQNKGWVKKGEFLDDFKAQTGKTYEGTRDERRINGMLEELEANAQTISDIKADKANDMDAAIAAEGTSAIARAKRAARRMFRGKSTVERARDTRKTANELNKIDGTDVDADVLSQADLSQEQDQLSKEAVKRRNLIRRLALGVLGNPQEFSKVDTFTELYKIVSQMSPGVTKVDLYNALVEPTRTQINARKTEILSRINNIKREVDAFEQLKNIINQVIPTLKTGDYQELKQSQSSRRLKELVDQIRFAAALDGDLSAAAYSEAINNLSHILSQYEAALDTLNDPMVNEANLRKNTLESIQQLFQDFEAIRDMKSLQNRRTKLEERLNNLDNESYNYVEEFMQVNSNEADFQANLEKAAEALGEDNITKQMAAIEDSRNIYNIIKEAFNIVSLDPNKTFTEVVDEIKETLERTGHPDITKKSILHALYDYTPAEKIKSDIKKHREEIRRTGKLFSDLIKIASGKNTLRDTSPTEAVSNVRTQADAVLEIIRELKELIKYNPNSLYIENQIKNLENKLSIAVEAISADLGLDVDGRPLKQVLEELQSFADEAASERLDRQFEELLKETERLDKTNDVADLNLSDFAKVPGLIERQLGKDLQEQMQRNAEQRKINNEKVKNLVLTTIKDKLKKNPKNKDALLDLERILDIRNRVESKNRKLVQLETNNIILKNKLREFLDRHKAQAPWYRNMLDNISNSSRLLVLAADVSFIFYQGALGIPFMGGQLIKDVVDSALSGSVAPLKNTAGLRIFGETLKVLSSMFVPDKALEYMGLPTASATFARQMAEIAQDADYELMIKSGLILSNPMNAQIEEELNLTSVLERVWGIGDAVKFIREFSERGYATYMNMLRVEMFKEGKRALEKKAAPQHLLEEGLTQYAEYVNTVTGAGQKFLWNESSNDTFNKFLDHGRHVFISPRLYASTFKSMGGMVASSIVSPVKWAQYKLREGNNDEASFRAYTDHLISLHHFRALTALALYTYGMGVFGAYSYALGAEEDDKEEYQSSFWKQYLHPMSSSFMRVEAGNRVFTITPLASYYRYAARSMIMLTRQFLTPQVFDQWTPTSDYIAEQIKRRRQGDEVLQTRVGEFVHWKIIPSLSAFGNVFLFNRDYLGNPVEPSIPRRLLIASKNGLLPIAIQGLVDGVAEGGLHSIDDSLIGMGIDMTGINSHRKYNWSDPIVENYRNKMKFKASYKIGKTWGNEILEESSYEAWIQHTAKSEFGDWLRYKLRRGEKPSKREMNSEWTEIIKDTWRRSSVPEEYLPRHWRNR